MNDREIVNKHCSLSWEEILLENNNNNGNFERTKENTRRSKKQEDVREKERRKLYMQLYGKREILIYFLILMLNNVAWFIFF